jgi:dTDP-4-amino-4,6-dideoxygalactose transaminase
MDLQAAIGLHQLARVETNWLRRRALWQRYDAAFANLQLGLPAPPAPHTRHGHHLYTVMIDAARCGLDRDTFLDAMNAARIGTGVHYLSIPEHPYYRQRFGWTPERWPHAMRLGRQTVSLPLSPAMSEADAARVIAAVRRILGAST